MERDHQASGSSAEGVRRSDLGATGPGGQGLAVGSESYSCPQPVRLSVCIEHGGSGGHLIRVQVTSADSIDSEWNVSRLRHEAPDAQRNSCRADSIARAAQGGDTSDVDGCTRAHTDVRGTTRHDVSCDESVELGRIVGGRNGAMECSPSTPLPLLLFQRSQYQREATSGALPHFSGGGVRTTGSDAQDEAGFA
jgi:hypothetical protein